MSEPVFLEAVDVKQIATEVVDSNTQFSHIDVNNILFLSQDGGSASKIAYVKGLRQDLAMLSRYRYILVVVAFHYNQLSEEDKAKVIEHELLHVSPEFDGKTIPHDIKDFRSMLNKYGINWVPEALSGVER